MSTIRLATEDAVELAELLQFVKDWITADDQTKASFADSSAPRATTRPTSAPTRSQTQIMEALSWLCAMTIERPAPGRARSVLR